LAELSPVDAAYAAGIRLPTGRSRGTDRRHRVPGVWPFRKRHRDDTEVLANIRSELLALGVPTAHLRDEDLLERITQFGRAARGAGISSVDAYRCIRSLARAARDQQVRL
jgi:hypothetical protein